MNIYFIRLCFITPLSYCISLSPILANNHETAIYSQQQEKSELLHPMPLLPKAPAPAASMLSTKHAATCLPPIWLALPFSLLLLMIATGPLLYKRFWHQHYPKIAIGLAGLVMAYYILLMHDSARPLEALMEYIQFIALISALYMAAGGILIEIHRYRYPAVINVVILLIGAILANLIGTTGASMLLIRPYIRFNRYRSKVFHIIFFILIVSNIGGALTPIGDPPLFLGFLKGVPFFWTLKNNWAPWGTILCFLIAVFYIFDVNRSEDTNPPAMNPKQPILTIRGKRNFLWLGLIILTIFIDPHLFSWVPTIHYHGHHFSFIREIVLLSITALSYCFANKLALQDNEFNIEPLKEVVVIFVGIFGTMAPVLSLISHYAQSSALSTIITPNTLYWATGMLSSVLDNAPTYLSFLAASMASQGADIMNPTDVQTYAAGGVFAHSILRLKAISIASVCFGAMTYIGNGPNFMVKSIAESLGIRMPSFLAYTIRFAFPFLLPLLGLIWLIHFFFVYI